MMPAINQVLLAASNSFAASILLKATFVASLALIATRLASRRRASIRHAILTAGFAVLLALPIASILAPPIHVALRIEQHSPALTTGAPLFFSEAVSAPQAGRIAQSSPRKSETQEFSLFDLLLAAWAIGVAVFLAPVIIGLWQVRSLRRTGLPWSHGNSVAALAKELGLRRRVDVLFHESVAGPMTCGILRPTLLFPVQAENWNDADVNRAIAHELEHVRRADWIAHCFSRAVCAAYWFHPLVWIAWRRLTLEAERACDDAVLSRSEATAYAEQLLALARHLSATNKTPLLALANRSDLAARVHSLLDSRQRRGRAGFLAIALACAAAALLIVAVSPMKLVAAAALGQDAQANNTPRPSFEVVSIKPDPDLGMGIIGGDPGRTFNAKRVSAQLLIMNAYNVKFFQISGGPNWLITARYDVEAKTDDATAAKAQTLTRDQLIAQNRLMLQSLLADRFKLSIHHSTAQMPVYSLVVTKAGRIPASKQDCGPPAGAPPAMQPGKPPDVPCGGFFQNWGHIAGVSVPISQLVSALSVFTATTVLDNTGLAGKYDITLNWTPDPGEMPPPPPGAPLPELDTNGPSLRDALQDQLGLKLVSTTGPVDTIVIDHIQQPSPN